MSREAPRTMWLVWSELDRDWSNVFFRERDAKKHAAEREDYGFGKHRVVRYDQPPAAGE